MNECLEWMSTHCPLSKVSWLLDRTGQDRKEQNKDMNEHKNTACDFLCLWPHAISVLQRDKDERVAACLGWGGHCFRVWFAFLVAQPKTEAEIEVICFFVRMDSGTSCGWKLLFP